MPCRSDYDEIEVSKANYEALIADLDRATRLLCGILRYHDPWEDGFENAQELTEWWEVHKEKDRQRAVREVDEAIAESARSAKGVTRALERAAEAKATLEAAMARLAEIPE